ncbi:hypothetical protein JHW43_003885, partial [Diplocarpon mali]
MAGGPTALAREMTGGAMVQRAMVVGGGAGGRRHVVDGDEVASPGSGLLVTRPRCPARENSAAWTGLHTALHSTLHLLPSPSTNTSPPHHVNSSSPHHHHRHLSAPLRPSPSMPRASKKPDDERPREGATLSIDVDSFVRTRDSVRSSPLCPLFPLFPSRQRVAHRGPQPASHHTPEHHPSTRVAADARALPF